MKTSFIPTSETSDFPIQNLPYGVFSVQGNTHVGVAIGNQAASLTVLDAEGMLSEKTGLFDTGSLNPFMEAGNETWASVRARLMDLLDADNAELRDNAGLREKVFFAQDEVTMLLPVDIGDYTDFYASREHATNVGCMFRDPDNALLPNWMHLPVGYHGRSSSIVVDGTPVCRPMGQTKADDVDAPSYGPCRLLDFELEMGLFIGQGNKLGTRVPIEEAGDKIFGMVILNDWSARDIQKWEYVPLGPFLAKNFASTISPWVVPMAALEPFQVDAIKQEKEVLPYLQEKTRKIYDIHLAVDIRSPQMDEYHTICRSNFKHLYWTPPQFVAHHSVTGCNLRPGDLMGSGTISGPTEDSYGSMLELCWKGTKPMTLPDGTERRFLQDGDTLNMRAWCQGDGYRIGFGNCSAEILPAGE